MSKKILITGASGLIGAKLSELLSKKHTLAHLGRTKREGTAPSFTWNVKANQMESAALDGIDTIVHLAGASVGGKRWTAAWKKEILDSRVQSTRLLFDELKKGQHTVKTFVSASAIGYYGFEGNSVFVEENDSGNDFLAQVTRQWEDEVDRIATLGIRVVKVRIGVVLSKKGGALEKMIQPIHYFVGAPLGSGNQYLPWIHLDDLCGIFQKAVEDDKVTGAYNAVANSATNKAMTKTIAKILNKPLWLPNIPAWVLKIVLGEMAQIVLNGSKVSSEKIRQAGYRFKFDNLEIALTDLLAG